MARHRFKVVHLPAGLSALPAKTYWYNAAKTAQDAVLMLNGQPPNTDNYGYWVQLLNKLKGDDAHTHAEYWGVAFDHTPVVTEWGEEAL